VSRESVTLQARTAAEAGMVDTCTISRKTGDSTDLQSAAVTVTIATIYSGKCRVQGHSPSMARPESVGGAYVFQTPFELQLPMSVTGVQVNDIVTITTSVLDQDLAGRTYWVKELFAKTHATSRRIGIIEVAG
jgi:hypothetical protein